MQSGRLWFLVAIGMLASEFFPPTTQRIDDLEPATRKSKRSSKNKLVLKWWFKFILDLQNTDSVLASGMVAQFN